MQRTSKFICSLLVLDFKIRTLHVRDMLLMKSDFILFAVIASKRLISTIIEFVNADT
jgi:hypothetical protein